MTTPLKSRTVLKPSFAAGIVLLLTIMAVATVIGFMYYDYDVKSRLSNIENNSRLIDHVHQEENRRLAFCLKYDIKDCTPEMITDWNKLHKDNQFPLRTQEQISRELNR